MDITQPNPSLLEKHQITLSDFHAFMETCDIQYGVNSNASQFYGASLAERNMLSRNSSYKTEAEKFKEKHGQDWQNLRSRLLDKMNDYALEFYNFRKPLGSPNGKNFW